VWRPCGETLTQFQPRQQKPRDLFAFTRKAPASAEPLLTIHMRTPSTGDGLWHIDPVSGTILNPAMVRSGSSGPLIGVGEASCVGVGVGVGGCVAVAVGAVVGMGDAVAIGVGLIVEGACFVVSVEGVMTGVADGA
jgi:hypothetical protein